MYEGQLVEMLEIIAGELSQLVSIENRLSSEVHQVRLLLTPVRAVKMELQFKGQGVGMPGTESDVQTIPCAAIETDAGGNPVTLNPANVLWAVQDSTIATLTQNADGSATFKALKPGTTDVTCTDNSQTPPLVGTDTLTGGVGNDRDGEDRRGR